MKPNKHEYFINLFSHLMYYGIIAFLAIGAWIDSGSFGAAIVGVIIGWVFYPVITRMFPLK